MIVLAIETSGREGSVALVRGDAAQSKPGKPPSANTPEQFEVLGTMSLAGGTYSAQLIPAISRLLEQAGLNKTALDLLAVNSGPGSFTGLRVGLSTVKALGEALAKPIVAVSGLEAVAAAAPHAGRLTVVLDAQRRELFVGEYEVRSPEERNSVVLPEKIAEKLLPVAEFIAERHQSGAATTIYTPDTALERLLREAGLAVTSVPRPQAREIARLGVAHFCSGNTISPEALDANYLRRSDAEIFSAPQGRSRT